nr:MAG TPA: hypothetical protein [Caudoviricetes sp.]
MRRARQRLTSCSYNQRKVSRGDCLGRLFVRYLVD